MARVIHMMKRRVWGGLRPGTVRLCPAGGMKPLRASAVTWLVFLMAGLLPLAGAAAGYNPDAKVALHVLPHDALRTCSRDFPDISACEDISTTCECCGAVDIFPVFFDIEECLGVEYGLTWPGSETCTFQTCSDLHIGDITVSGDGISQVWFACRVGPAVIPGFGWIDFAQPTRVCVAPHPYTGVISILDCHEHVVEPVAVFCGGLCDETGDNPCQTVFLPLNLSKTGDMEASCAAPGDTISYMLAYDNDRNTEAVHNVTLVDDLPSETALLSSSAGGTYDPFDHTVTWNTGTLAGGASGTAEVTVVVEATVMPGGTIANRCTITADETSTTQASDYVDVCPETFEPLDLGMEDDAGGECVDPGQILTYSLGYDNGSNSYDVRDVVLVDSLPIEVQYVACSGGGDYDPGAHTVTWDLGDLAAGEDGVQEVITTVAGDIQPAASICNRATITAHNTPPTAVAACVTACTDLISIALTKVGLIDSTCVEPGDQVIYRIHYANPNAFELHGVGLVDFMPDETVFMSADPGATYNPSEHTVTWELGSLAAGGDGGVEITAQIAAGVPPGLMVVNRCQATADGAIPSEAEASIAACSLAHLHLAKTTGLSGCVSRGGRVTYTISFDNTANPRDVENVTLTDYLSSSVDFKSATGGGVYQATGRRVVWNLGTLAAGATGTVHLTVEVKYSVSPGSRIDNRCQIGGTGTGTTQANRSIDVCQEGGFPFKAAVHVVEHNSHRTCSTGLPAIGYCRDIQTTSDATSIDAFPVFFDFDQYLGLEYGLAWCDSGPCEAALFTSCSDLVIGSIEHSGDGISQTWFGCRPAPAVPGWAWIYATGPSHVCVVPHPISQSIYVLGCAENLGTPMCNFCAGVGGQLGDDPCVPTNVRPTTWGGIKAMFR
jgi:uncharacterized repeat protein (TIGR01451 family)